MSSPTSRTTESRTMTQAIDPIELSAARTVIENHVPGACLGLEHARARDLPLPGAFCRAPRARPWKTLQHLPSRRPPCHTHEPLAGHAARTPNSDAEGRRTPRSGAGTGSGRARA